MADFIKDRTDIFYCSDLDANSIKGVIINDNDYILVDGNGVGYKFCPNVSITSYVVTNDFDVSNLVYCKCSNSIFAYSNFYKIVVIAYVFLFCFVGLVNVCTSILRKGGIFGDVI